jgi:hypothetical protein
MTTIGGAPHTSNVYEHEQKLLMANFDRKPAPRTVEDLTIEQLQKKRASAARGIPDTGTDKRSDGLFDRLRREGLPRGGQIDDGCQHQPEWEKEDRAKAACEQDEQSTQKTDHNMNPEHGSLVAVHKAG